MSHETMHETEQRLGALLAAERVVGEPSADDQRRVWGNLEARIAAVAAVPPQPRTRWWRRGLLAAALAGGAGLLGTQPNPQQTPADAPAALEPAEAGDASPTIPWQHAVRSQPVPVQVAAPPIDVDEDRNSAATKPSPASHAKARTTRRRRVATPVPEDERPPEMPSTLAEQLELIRAARDALERGRPSVARQHVQEYRERFSDGALVEEAEGIAAAARCADGDDGAVTRQAFGTRWPSSIHAKLVERFCGKQGPGSTSVE